jgi:hypothetical protein
MRGDSFYPCYLFDWRQGCQLSGNYFNLKILFLKLATFCSVQDFEMRPAQLPAFFLKNYCRFTIENPILHKAFLCKFPSLKF